MTADQARRRIVALSLITTMVLVGFLIISPLFLPLTSADGFRLVQIILPVFAGYIGSAVLFIFQRPNSDLTIQEPHLLRTIINGIFAIFWFFYILLMVYFYASNRPGPGTGMYIDELANYFTVLVALLNITVGAASAFLFRSDPGALAREVQEAVDKKN